jgi:hypothetical protein
MKYPREFLTGLAACALLITLSGCAGSSMQWPTTQPAAPTMDTTGKSFPRAQNCLSIKQATPSQFVCNGKVYTANQLRKLREDAAKAASSS